MGVRAGEREDGVVKGYLSVEERDAIQSQRYKDRKKSVQTENVFDQVD